MKKLLIFILGSLLIISFAYSKSKPNVILILVDDLGSMDIGCYGSSFHETPHIDQLGKEGVIFDNAYSASPICTPTRASILTGKYPSRLGITNHSGITGSQGPKYKLIAPKPIANLPHEENTLAETLKGHGYRTAHIGKWHLQQHNLKTKEFFPEAHGFDINIAGHRYGQPGSFHYPYKSKRHPSTNVPGLDDGQEGEYLTDRLTDEAIKFIDKNQDEPFFLNLWYYTVHTPIEAKKEKEEKYKKKAKALNLPKNQGVPEYASWQRKYQDEPKYAGMVESLDENVSRILQKLSELQLDQNTIIIFTSDNGGLSTKKNKTAPTSNLPLRAGKGWIYEGGIKVPMIVRYPPITTQHYRSKEAVVSTDIYPSILDMANLPLLPEQHVDGVSIKPVLTSTEGKLDRKAIYFHYPHYHHINSMGPSGAVRMGKYKLVERYETGDIELFDMEADIGETNDLSKKLPEIAREMQGMLHQWLKDTNSPTNKINPNFNGTIPMHKAT